MFTVCSKCSLRLTVSPTDLRAAQGYVRCGRCRNVFNALAALSEETHESTGVHRTNIAMPVPPPSARTALHDDDTDLEFDASATDVASIFVTPPRTQQTGTFESIILRGTLPGDEPQESPDDVNVMHLPARELAALEAAAEQAVREQAALATLDDVFATTLTGSYAPPDGSAAHAALAADIAAATAAIAADPLTQPEPPRTSRLPQWLPATACVMLALVLVAQAVHHWRDSLAAGPLGRPLAALYAALGLPLSPHWDVSRYEVRQLGAQAAAAGGNIQIHAAISNRAGGAQPLPLLRVTLEDSFGNRIAARDLTPAEYLTSASARAAAGTTLAPDAQVEAIATFVDPGQSAVGFELDACLAVRAGRIVCANDPGKAAP